MQHIGCLYWVFKIYEDSYTDKHQTWSNQEPFGLQNLVTTKLAPVFWDCKAKYHLDFHSTSTLQIACIHFHLDEPHQRRHAQQYLHITHTHLVRNSTLLCTDQSHSIPLSRPWNLINIVWHTWDKHTRLNCIKLKRMWHIRYTNIPYFEGWLIMSPSTE